MSFFNFGNRNTMRPTKSHKHQRRNTLSQYAQKTLHATLGSATMTTAVQCPPGEDENDWIGCNAIDFFNELSLLYASIESKCTAESCPIMCASGYQYFWKDGVKVMRPTPLPAPQYVDAMMQWAESQLNDPSIFPTTVGQTYPKKFKKICKTIFKRFFRVYAHLYHHHFSELVAMGAEGIINTCFKHFLFFVLEFDLISQQEMAPLADLIARFSAEEEAKAKRSADE